MNTPNLFIIGATKCGTTSLHAWLDVHPEICMSRIKESGFFLTPDLHHPGIRNAAGGDALAGYLSLFEGCNAGTRYLGESSTGYTHFPLRLGVPDRVRSFNPDARLIYVLRDPVQRTISHYWWNVRYEGERRGMLAAISEDRHYCDVSNYAMQLKEWLRCFDLSSIYITTIEEISASPVEEMASLLQWLGLDHKSASQCIGEPENRTPDCFEVPRLHRLHQLRHSHFWEVLGPRVPKWLRRLGRKAAEREIAVRHSPAELAAVEDYLREKQLKEVAELSALLGQPFPEWRRLAGGQRDSHQGAGPCRVQCS